MKIYYIDLSETWGIKDPQSGEEYEWEIEDDFNPLHESSFITAVFPYEFPDDTTYSTDEKFTSEWIAFYEVNKIIIDEDGDEGDVPVEELLEKFESPHIVLELTSYGMACGPVSFTQYFIFEEKYESQLEDLLLKNS